MLTTSTLSETISDNIQVPYYVDETYDTQTPYYVDETYDAQVFSHYEDETYDTQVRIVPSTNFYSNSSIHYQCVFFSFDDNNNSLTYEEWDCHREIYSVRIYPGLYCADFGYSYTVEVYCIINTRTHCRNSGTSQPYYNDDQGNAVKILLGTRQVIGGYNTVTEIVLRYRTETKINKYFQEFL